MNRLAWLLILSIQTTLAYAEILAVHDTPAGKIAIDNGRIVANGTRLYINRQYDGKQVSLDSEHILSSAGRNPGLFLSIYRDKALPDQKSRTQHIVITDASGKELRQSNVVDSGIDFDWGDNNYVLFENGAMYFGIYSPRRMQFVYRDGRLAENKGAWRGPAKPETYIEPLGTDPCFNVHTVEDCREELEREKAAKQAERKRKNAPSAGAK